MKGGKMRRDQRKFKATAKKVRSINISAKSKRGGICL